MKYRYTDEQIEYIRENLFSARTYYDLAESFTRKFPEHPVDYRSLQKFARNMGMRKGTHNVRKERLKPKNPIGTVIWNGRKAARVKTENGYVAANKYFKNVFFQGQDGHIVWLDGNPKNCTRDNAELVEQSVYSSLCWRSWFFKDRELQKAAILAARLLLFFPECIHNENQYLGIRGQNG